jgi:phage tail sheath protein FI
VVPYLYYRRHLGIQEAAEYELEDSGLEVVLNDSRVLDYFLENNSYDLSQTIRDGVLNGSYTAIAFNEEDPAIANDAVWTYDPQNNNSGSTLATVWNLFVNKDASDVSMLVAAGVGINNPFTKKYETLNTQVMQAMINVCESRKDCFCLFDGVYEPDITKAVTKMIGAGNLSLGRWGAIYDGRGVFQDSLYTNSQVDCMKSIQLAAIITANRQGGVFWIPPAGDEAYVPSAWGTKERFTRSYSSEDKNCDHAKLSDIHVNATRVNKDGIRIWGDFTCQMEDTAFNQIHVTMLVAGIHKMFYKYLDHKVFKLNTTVLRAQITSDLQDKLNNIKRQNPPGLIEGKVICDDTNNTPELIDQNFLIVDLKLLPPKSTRWIILRTSVESTKNGKNITTDVLQA